MTSRQIFLSHHSAEKPTIRRLKARLERPDLRVWLDEREIEPLEPLSEKVLDGLRSSAFFLAWWFGEFGASVACQFELITALASAQPQAAVGQILVVGPEAILSDAALGRLKAVKLPILPADPSDAALDTLADQLCAHIAAHDKVQSFGAMGLRVARSDEAADPRFVGRARELLELHAQLWADAPGVEGQGAAQALVSGLGGQGKTQLAQEYARRFAVCYPGGLLRLNLPGDTVSEADIDREIDTALLRAAQRRNLPTGTGARDEVRGALFHYFNGKGAYLWLVDNVPSRANEAQIAALRAPSGEGTTLFTARARLPGIAAYPLDRMRPADALRLLKRIAEAQEGPIYPADRLEPLIQHVHGHALSLTLLGHALADGITPETLLAQVKGTPVAGLESLMEKFEADEDTFRPVLATLRTTLDRLPTQGPPGTSRTLLGLLPHLAAAPVPVKLLQQALGEAGLAAAQRPLYSLGLIDRDTRAAFPGGEAVPVLSLHPLLAEVVTLLPGFTDAAPVAGWLEAIDSALLADMQAIDANAGHHRSNPVSGWLLPHAIKRAEAGLAQREAGLGSVTGQALHLVGALAGARALQEYALQVDRCKLGPEHPDTLTSMNNLAVTLSAQGNLLAAQSLQEEVVISFLRIHGQEHSYTLASMNNLAQTLWKSGDLPKALVLQEQVLEVQQRTLGPAHPDTLITINNLAGILRAQNDLTRAQKLYEKALELFQKKFGSKHPNTLTVMNNLANTFFAQNKLNEARKIHESVLQLRRSRLGEEHPDTLISMNNLAGVLGALDDLAGACTLQEQVFEVRSRTLGPEHPATLTSQNNLAGTLADQGHLSKARALQEGALETRRRRLGPAHPDTLTSMNNLAAILCAQGDHSAARALLEEGLSSLRKSLNEEHPRVLICIANLARTVADLGDLPAARALLAPTLHLIPTIPQADVQNALTNTARLLDLPLPGDPP
ncbi:tetratricopeptide repeat protein [Elstera cyanobacteriorum]|uniref:TIR domain-containing protein n=1 Tax=Elstera cyanobacteriorum TaxID=2022747 RepID=A0A255XYA9_9PROT|nr:toll/interleukin-1 receptor domain-containing protein [Elstera cyanobacteriorum]OYQ21881.1 hypothetical protein CHR90_00895 [Elstera cyanobacteriorum]GGA02736.1 tetratricopeptide repeat protein [Elstera cyanobacteriorum]